MNSGFDKTKQLEIEQLQADILKNERRARAINEEAWDNLIKAELKRFKEEAEKEKMQKRKAVMQQLKRANEGWLSPAEKLAIIKFQRRFDNPNRQPKQVEYPLTQNQKIKQQEKQFSSFTQAQHEMQFQPKPASRPNPFSAPKM